MDEQQKIQQKNAIIITGKIPASKKNGKTTFTQQNKNQASLIFTVSPTAETNRIWCTSFGKKKKKKNLAITVANIVAEITSRKHLSM